ncbi:MAG: cellulase family glycosylhydrolase [Ignavibacteriales bacterium]|nr:cellulase family glycosylhydrolase [Ignavibacteriales bacterium]
MRRSKIILALHVWMMIVVLILNTNHSLFAQHTTIVQQFGQLGTKGGSIVDKSGTAVTLRGMSLFFSQWEPEFYNYDCIRWLRDDWKCTVIRTAMGIEEDGYLANPSREKAKIKTVIDACLSLGIYVIVNWHDFHAEQHKDEAIAFFEEIATLYGNSPNVIYEIYSEPETTDWETVRSYADEVISRIRAIDPDNLIIVGTPWWSQYVDEASENPLPYSNLAYALHFYAASHKQELRDRAMVALNRGLTLFVSEFGGGDYTGTVGIDYDELDAWFKLMDDHNISWCNWAIEDRGTTASALQSGASSTGGWSVSVLTESGQLMRNKIRSTNPALPAEVDSSEQSPLRYEVRQNSPNPFNYSTSIQFDLPEETTVQVTVYNIIGQEIKRLVDGTQQRGSHTLRWDGKNDAGTIVPSGVYFYSLTTASSRVFVRKLLFAK